MRSSEPQSEWAARRAARAWLQECVRNAWASEHLRGVMRRAEDSAAAEAAMEDAFTRAERHLREHLHETTDGHEDA